MLSKVDSCKRSSDRIQKLPKFASAGTIHTTIVPIMDGTGQRDIVNSLSEYAGTDGGIHANGNTSLMQRSSSAGENHGALTQVANDERRSDIRASRRSHSGRAWRPKLYAPVRQQSKRIGRLGRLHTSVFSGKARQACPEEFCGWA